MPAIMSAIEKDLCNKVFVPISFFITCGNYFDNIYVAIIKNNG